MGIKSASLVTFGSALGTLLMRGQYLGGGLSNNKQTMSLDALGRDLLTGASIEAIGFLEQGDQDSAELVLSSSVIFSCG